MVLLFDPGGLQLIERKRIVGRTERVPGSCTVCDVYRESVGIVFLALGQKTGSMWVMHLEYLLMLSPFRRALGSRELTPARSQYTVNCALAATFQVNRRLTKLYITFLLRTS